MTVAILKKPKEALSLPAMEWLSTSEQNIQQVFKESIDHAN